VSLRPGAVGNLLLNATPLVIPLAGKKDISIQIVPSGADTVSVEGTLESPDDAGATWFSLIAATNTATLVTLAGPVSAIRVTRASGSTVLSKVVVLTPVN
jgi:hypothetical protein